MCAVEISPQFNIKTKQEKQLLYEKLEKEVHPIHRYAAHNRVDLLQALPDGDIDICDNFARNTPLMMATVYHARNAATFLYNKGANPFRKMLPVSVRMTLPLEIMMQSSLVFLVRIKSLSLLHSIYNTKIKFQMIRLMSILSRSQKRNICLVESCKSRAT